MDKSLNLSFENLCYQVDRGVFLSDHQPKQILTELSGEFRSSELSVVVGPSGSGKSSLLDVISGYKRGKISGKIKINENVVSNGVVRRVSSYVPQDNKLHGYLTVQETMLFAACFKIIDLQSIHKKVEKILTSLRMTKQADTFVKHLSGGQQKRLSIAVELVDDPSILFLDEPTTGLDSNAAFQCIRLLKKLAQEGKTIICTIHTPSALIFEMFDHLYALADGCCIYQGSSKNLVPFLQELDLICPEIYSPSDFLLEIATNDYGPQNHRLTKRIRNGSNANYRLTSSPIRQSLINSRRDIRSPSCSIYTLTYTQQVIHLLHRSFLIGTRDKTLILLRLCIHLVMGFVLGFVYRDVGDGASKFFDNYRFIITCVVFQLYTSYFSLQTAIPLEFPILKRERFNRWYSSTAFFSAFIIIDLPIIFLCSLTYVSITYAMTNQPPELHRFLLFFVISLALNYASQGIGLVGSALLDVKTAVISSGIFLAPFMTFSSALLLMRDTSAGFHWLFHANFMDNAIKGSLQAIFGYNRTKMECDSTYCHYSYPNKILDEFEADVSVERVLLVLACYAIVSRIITYAFIRYRLKNCCG